MSPSGLLNSMKKKKTETENQDEKEMRSPFGLHTTRPNPLASMSPTGETGDARGRRKVVAELGSRDPVLRCLAKEKCNENDGRTRTPGSRPVAGGKPVCDTHPVENVPKSHVDERAGLSSFESPGADISPAGRKGRAMVGRATKSRACCSCRVRTATCGCQSPPCTLPRP